MGVSVDPIPQNHIIIIFGNKNVPKGTICPAETGISGAPGHSFPFFGVGISPGPWYTYIPETRETPLERGAAAQTLGQGEETWRKDTRLPLCSTL